MQAKGVKPRLLVIDSVSAFYWADRCVRSGGRSPPAWEQAHRAICGGNSYAALGTQRAHESLAEDISIAARRYGLLVLATAAVREMGGSVATAVAATSRGQIMAPSWQAIVGDRLFLEGGAHGSDTCRYASWESGLAAKAVAPGDTAPCDWHRDAFVIDEAGIRIVQATGQHQQ